MNIKTAIDEQVRDSGLMSRAFANLKKKGPITKGKIASRLQALETLWNGIGDRHKVILSLKTDVSLDYFANDFIADAQDIFLDQRAELIDADIALEELVVPADATQPPTDGTPHPPTRPRKLPAIELPVSSGKYCDWTSHKDLFKTPVASHDGISDDERLHYLKCLSGDAARRIKSIAVTTGNYECDGSRLVAHYDNKRSLVNWSLSALFQIRNLTMESVSGLRQLRDATAEAVDTLRSLDRPVDKWDDILVHITAKRLDTQTRRD